MNDLLDRENFNIHKIDEFTACLSDKITGTIFIPDMEEQICIVKEFEKTLKFVVFMMHRDTEVGLASLSAREPTTTPQYDVFMNSFWILSFSDRFKIMLPKKKPPNFLHTYLPSSEK